jgi:hypothetical protein
MGQYRALMSFTRDGKMYAFGDVLELPDEDPEDFRSVGMLLEYGVIDVPPKSAEKSDVEQK